jgi:hypothetical protein
MSIHDIQMHPICSGVNSAGGFCPDSAEVGGEERGGDDAILVVPLFHAASHKVKTSLRRAKKSVPEEDLFSEWFGQGGVLFEENRLKIRLVLAGC